MLYGTEAVATEAVGAAAKGHKTKRDRDASKDAVQVAGMSVKELKKVRAGPIILYLYIQLLYTFIAVFTPMYNPLYM